MNADSGSRGFQAGTAREGRDRSDMDKMNSSSDLRGRQVVNSRYGLGIVVRVEPREPPNEPLVWVRFEQDDEPQRAFGLGALYNEQYFTRPASPAGSEEVEAIQEACEAAGSADTSDARNEARQQVIQQICRTRGIEVLAHFTRTCNLRSILKAGLLDRQTLEGWRDDEAPVFNDRKRLDGFKEAVCLSISFPNHSMFHKYSLDKKNQWAVLLLKASVLWELDCAFFEDNAASGRVKGVPLVERKRAVALKRMFEDLGPVHRRQRALPPNYPTSHQAEVLVFEPVPPMYITAVHFYTKEARLRWLRDKGDVASLRTCADRQYFSSRDYCLMLGASQQGAYLDSSEEEEIRF